MFDARLIARFWAKVDKRGPDECWNWTAYKYPRTKFGPNGYGGFNVSSKIWKAHRFSYFLANGDIPGNLCVCHRCDNPACVNPAHLFLGTHAENNADAAKKGRHVAPPNTNGFDKRRQFGVLNVKAKITANAVRAIRAEYAQGATSQQSIADRFGLRQTQVSRIIRRERWSHVA